MDNKLVESLEYLKDKSNTLGTEYIQSTMQSADDASQKLFFLASFYGTAFRLTQKALVSTGDTTLSKPPVFYLADLSYELILCLYLLKHTSFIESSGINTCIWGYNKSLLQRVKSLFMRADKAEVPQGLGYLFSMKEESSSFCFSSLDLKVKSKQVNCTDFEETLQLLPTDFVQSSVDADITPLKLKLINFCELSLMFMLGKQREDLDLYVNALKEENLDVKHLF